MVFTVANLPEIEAHLATSPTLTEGGLPGPLDASIFFAIGSTYTFIQNFPIAPQLLTFTIGIFSLLVSLPYS
jgi:hypothetical protein